MDAAACAACVAAGAEWVPVILCHESDGSRDRVFALCMFGLRRSFNGSVPGPAAASEVRVVVLILVVSICFSLKLDFCYLLRAFEAGQHALQALLADLLAHLTTLSQLD
jgi:hypothetical protein